MPASDLARRLAALACLLLLVAPVRAQDDDGSEDDPFLDPNLPGQPGGPNQPLDPNDPMLGGAKGGPMTDPEMGMKVHQQTAAALLQWSWDHGYVPSREGEKPLSEKDAILALAGHDERPMLLLRECSSCQRDDHKMLMQELVNDKTIVYGRWYHCVKLPADSIKPDSPFHSFFTARLPTHVVVATADGNVVGELGVRAKPAELWKLLSSGLKKSYKKDPDAAVKGMLVTLDDLDLCEKDLAKAEDEVIRMKALKDPPLKDIEKLEAKKKLLTEQRVKLIDKARALDDLQLKPLAPPAAGG